MLIQQALDSDVNVGCLMSKSAQVKFTLDIRAKDDSIRKNTLSDIERNVHDICNSRAVTCEIQRKVLTRPHLTTGFLPFFSITFSTLASTYVDP